MSSSILIVEDDRNAGMLLKGFLESEGFSVQLGPTARSGLQAFLTDVYGLCIVDCSLPDYDGFELAKEIRMRDKDVPIIFLTARSLLEDKIRGFQSGADDYITKPFEPFELLYKIKAILRRANPQPKSGTTHQIGEFVFDYEMQTLTHNGETLRVTTTENEVLKMLCARKNQITRKDEILLAIWGESDYFKGRSLDVFIARLRKYLDADKSIKIENVHGVGFILSDVV